MSEVGSAYFTLLPSVKGLQGALGKEVAGLDGAGAGRTIGNSMGTGIVGSLKSLVGPALLTLGAAKGFEFAKSAVDSFSQLEDSSAAATVVFSGNLDRIQALSKTASTSLGLNSQQVINSASMFGTYGKAAGLAGEDLETFAVKMTGLSGDLASFKGTSTEDAITAVGAAMRGEFEPIRQYGVLLDDATLRNKALEMGLISSTKEALTPANKTLAAQAAILEQTKDAQGDFQRTSTSTANVQKTLAAESENVSAKIGGLLAPAFTAVRLKALDGVRGLSSWLDTVGQLGPRVGDAMAGIKAFVLEGDFTGALSRAFGVEEDSPIIGGLFTLRETVMEVIGAAKGVFGSLALSVGPLVPLVFQLWQSFSPLSLVFQSLAPVLPALLGAFSSLIGAVGGALTTALSAALPALTQLSSLLIDSLGTVFAAVAPMVVSLLAQMGDLFTQLAPVVGTLIGTVAQLVGQLVSALVPILTQLAVAVFPMVAEIVGVVIAAIVPLVQQIAAVLVPVIQALLPVVITVFQAVANVVQSVMQIVMGIIQVVTGLISGNWDQVWTGMGNVFSGIWNLIVSVVRGALAIVGQVVISGVSLATNFMRSAFEGVAGFLGGVWNNVVNGVSSMIGNVVGFFSSLPGKLVGALGNVVGTLYNAGVNIVQGLINGIGSMMGAIGRAVLNIVPEAIRGPFEALLGIHSPSLVAVWWGQMLGAGLVQGVKSSYTEVAGAVRGLVNPTQAVAVQGNRSSYDVSRGTYRSGPLVEQKVYPSEKMSEQNLATVSAEKIVGALT